MSNVIDIRTGKPFVSKTVPPEIDKAHRAGYKKGFDDGCGEETKAILGYLYAQIKAIEAAKLAPENVENIKFYDSMIDYTTGLIVELSEVSARI